MDRHRPRTRLRDDPKPGEVELYRQNVSTSRSGDEYGRQVSGSYETDLPLTTGDLMGLSQGEALVQSPDGWWLCKLSK